jgi:hypothetical protein
LVVLTVREIVAADDCRVASTPAKADYSVAISSRTAAIGGIRSPNGKQSA